MSEIDRTDVSAPPPDNDLGQNAVPLLKVDLDRWNPRSQEVPPERYEVCDICGFIYKRSLLVRFRQKWYCKPQYCYHDIRGILLKENPEVYFKDQGLADDMR